MIKKNIITLTCLFIALLVAVMFSIRLIQLNKQYPEAQVKKMELGKFTTYEGVKLSIIDNYLLSQEEILHKYPSYASELERIPYEIKGLFISVKLKNTSKEEKTVRLELLSLQAKGVATQNDLSLYILMPENETKTIHPTLASGEEKTVIIPFTINERMFKNSDWKNIENAQFKLMVDLYPVRKEYILK